MIRSQDSFREIPPLINTDVEDPLQAHHLPVFSTPTKKFLPPPSTDRHEPETKHHSQDSDALDVLCQKMTSVQVQGRPEDEFRDISSEMFKQMVQEVTSSNPSAQHAGAVKFRRLLAVEDINQYLDKVISSNVLPAVARLLQSPRHESQFEAAWVLTNVAAGQSQHTQAVVGCGCVGRLVELMDSPFLDVKEQAAWALGNIAGDSSSLRRVVLEAGAVPALVQLLAGQCEVFLAASRQSQRTPSSISTLRICIWALSNFCRGYGGSADAINAYLIQYALPVITTLLEQFRDAEILMDAAWALSRTLRGINESMADVIVDRRLATALLKLLQDDYIDEVRIPALRALINIVSGNDAQTQVVLDVGGLELLGSLLRDPCEVIRKEAALIVSNIVAGSLDQVQAVIDAGLIEPICTILRHDDWKAKREACWALSNATLHREPSQIGTIVREGTIPLMLDMLRASASTDPKLSIKVIEFLHNILYVGEPNENTRDDMDLIGKFSGLRVDHPAGFGGGDENSDGGGAQTFLQKVQGKARRSPNVYVRPVMEGGRGGSMEGLDTLAAVLQAAPAAYGGKETRDLTRTILRSWFGTDVNASGEFRLI